MVSGPDIGLDLTTWATYREPSGANTVSRPREQRAETHPLSRHRTPRHGVADAVTRVLFARSRGTTDAALSADMRQPEVPQPRTLQKREHPTTLHCTQCGDFLDATRMQRLTRTDNVLCRDCAFDQLPCTD